MYSGKQDRPELRKSPKIPCDVEFFTLFFRKLGLLRWEEVREEEDRRILARPIFSRQQGRKSFYALK